MPPGYLCCDCCLTASTSWSHKWCLWGISGHFFPNPFSCRMPPKAFWLAHHMLPAFSPMQVPSLPPTCKPPRLLKLPSASVPTAASPYLSPRRSELPRAVTPPLLCTGDDLTLQVVSVTSSCQFLCRLSPFRRPSPAARGGLAGSLVCISLLTYLPSPRSCELQKMVTE